MYKKKERPADGWPTQQSDNRPFFVYDPEGDGFTYYATEQERDEAAEMVIQGYLDEGWSEEVTSVVAGILTHKSTQTNLQERPDDDKINEDNEDEDGTYWGDWTHICNYELLPIAPDKT